MTEKDKKRLTAYYRGLVLQVEAQAKDLQDKCNFGELFTKVNRAIESIESLIVLKELLEETPEEKLKSLS